MTNSLLPSGELILNQLNINPCELRTNFPSCEQRSHYRAVINWLTKYNPKSNATISEKTKGYQEALYHLRQVEDWERASKMLNLIAIAESSPAMF